MKKTVYAVVLTVLASCTTTGSLPGGNAQGSVTATNTISQSQTGNVSNIATNDVQGGSVTGSTSGAASQTIPVNLALDPSSFSSLFGVKAPITNPTVAQANTAKAVATNKGDESSISAASKCLGDLKNCVISIVPGS